MYTPPTIVEPLACLVF